MSQAITVPDFRQLVADRFSLLTPRDWFVLSQDPGLLGEVATELIFREVYQPIYERFGQDLPDNATWIEKSLSYEVYAQLSRYFTQSA